MRDFKKLRVWQAAHPLVLATYRETQWFPLREVYGLTAQMRRAAASIGSNISEACGKPTDADFCRYLSIAFGSASELKYQLLLSSDLGYLADSAHQDLERQVDIVMRMLAVFIKRSSRTLHATRRGVTTSSQQPTANS